MCDIRKLKRNYNKIAFDSHAILFLVLFQFYRRIDVTDQGMKVGGAKAKAKARTGLKDEITQRDAEAEPRSACLANPPQT